MRALSVFSLLFCMLSLAGCLPEERFWWSPNGDRALVLHEGDLHIAGSDGTLTGMLTELSEGEVTVKSGSWLQDGTGFVCHRERAVKSWEEVRPLIGSDELDEIERWMPAVPSMLEAFVKLSKDASQFDHILAHMPQESRAAFGVAALRLFLQKPEVVEKILAPLPKAAQMLDTLGKDARFTLDEIVLVKLDGAKTAGVTTLKTSGPLRRMMYPRLSPKHPALSFYRLGEHDESASLNVISLDGKSELEVSVNATAAQWSADGRELIFTSPFSGEQSELQTIFHREVVQESGQLMKPSHEPQPDGSLQKVEGKDRVCDAKVIATTLFPASPAIAALQDGRVLFAGLPVTFPMVDSETKPAPLLYLAAADGKSVSVVPTQPGDLPTELAFFTVSPDGDRVAIVESGTDAVAVLTLATGRVQIISPARPNPSRSCRTMPAWKSNTELTFAAVSEAKKTPCWMQWSEAGGLRVLSGTWPAEFTSEWLRESKSADSP